MKQLTTWNDKPEFWTIRFTKRMKLGEVILCIHEKGPFPARVIDIQRTIGCRLPDSILFDATGMETREEAYLWLSTFKHVTGRTKIIAYKLKRL